MVRKALAFLLLGLVVAGCKDDSAAAMNTPAPNPQAAVIADQLAKMPASQRPAFMEQNSWQTVNADPKVLARIKALMDEANVKH